MWRRNEGEAQPKGKEFPSLLYDMTNDEYLPCGKVTHSNSISNMKASERQFKAHDTWKVELEELKETGKLINSTFRDMLEPSNLRTDIGPT